MTVETDLVAFLKSDPDIAALVDDRVYSTGFKPQNSDKPAVTFVRTDTEWALYVDSGQDNPVAINFAIDSWSPDLTQSRELRNRVRARIQNLRGMMGATDVMRIYFLTGPVDVYEEQLKEFRSTFVVVLHSRNE